MVTKRRTGKEKQPAKPKPKSRAASSSRRKPSRSRRKPSRQPIDLQQRTFQVFAEQADSLWSRLTDQCRQFAYGFNQAVGAPALEVQAEPTTLRVTYPRGDAELFVQLDKVERYVQAWLNTGCVTYGSCLTAPLPVGLTVNGNELQFALGGDIASDEQVAVTLLTQLTSGNGEPERS
jgi:hypothetical protein